MDFSYLTKVTKLNVAALAALSRAPMPPEPTAEGAVSIDTTISWKSVPNAAAYIIRWRPTDTADWEHSLRRPGTATNHALGGVRLDAWVFGVSSVSAGGCEDRPGVV